MTFYVAIIVVLSVTALGVLGCLAGAWLLAGRTWSDETEVCPICGQIRQGEDACPRCGMK
jgi:hypothetical protein